MRFVRRNELDRGTESKIGSRREDIVEKQAGIDSSVNGFVPGGFTKELVGNQAVLQMLKSRDIHRQEKNDEGKQIISDEAMLTVIQLILGNPLYIPINPAMVALTWAANAAGYDVTGHAVGFSGGQDMALGVTGGLSTGGVAMIEYPSLDISAISFGQVSKLLGLHLGGGTNFVIAVRISRDETVGGASQGESEWGGESLEAKLGVVLEGDFSIGKSVWEEGSGWIASEVSVPLPWEIPEFGASVGESETDVEEIF